MSAAMGDVGAGGAPPRSSSTDGRLPRWYTDAKPGIAVHCGLYSVPAFRGQNDADPGMTALRTHAVAVHPGCVAKGADP
jgi:hypothetical protein